MHLFETMLPVLTRPVRNSGLASRLLPTEASTLRKDLGGVGEAASDRETNVLTILPFCLTSERI
jgi:hypothetical protein